MIARTEGNQTTEFEYDYDNRLVRIVYPNGSEVRFGYDGLGRRVFRQEGASVRYFYFDGDKIIAEREGSFWVVRYLLGLKPCGYVVSGQVRVYHADRLGSVRWVTDGSGNLVASYVYEGFGKVMGQSGGGGGPYQFCGLWGYRNDQDAGLMHVGARYYEVETGRFIQKDSTVSINDYYYVGNNPIMRVDPDGEDWLDTATNFFAGMGDAITFGLTDKIRDWIGVNDVVDHNSGAYKGGKIAGYAWWVAFNVTGYATGYEFAIGRNFRIAPWGNRTGHPIGRFPHYHSRVIDPKTGLTKPGQGIGRHRPWEVKSTDKSFWDRF
jgi:RHS repeat-associated protein